MGWHRLTSLRATLALDDLTEIVERESSATDIDECTYDRPHHITQEPVGGNLEIPGRGRCLMPLGDGDMTDGGLHVGMGLTECAKVRHCRYHRKMQVQQGKEGLDAY